MAIREREYGADTKWAFIRHFPFQSFSFMLLIEQEIDIPAAKERGSLLSYFDVCVLASSILPLYSKYEIEKIVVIATSIPSTYRYYPRPLFSIQTTSRQLRVGPSNASFSPEWNSILSVIGTAASGFNASLWAAMKSGHPFGFMENF